jgi:hypothetical protein
MSPLGCPLAEPFLPEGDRPVRSRHVGDYSMAATATLPVFALPPEKATWRRSIALSSLRVGLEQLL